MTTTEQTLSTESQNVLNLLRKHAEGSSNDGWRDVYIDNARPDGMTCRAYAGHLSALKGAGVYKPIDGYAWGEVRMG